MLLYINQNLFKLLLARPLSRLYTSELKIRFWTDFGEVENPNFGFACV